MTTSNTDLDLYAIADHAVEINRVNRSVKSSLRIFYDLVPYARNLDDDFYTACVRKLKVSPSAIDAFMRVDALPSKLMLWRLITQRKHIRYGLHQPMFTAIPFDETAVAEIDMSRYRPRLTILTGVAALITYEDRYYHSISVARTKSNHLSLSGFRVMLKLPAGLTDMRDIFRLAREMDEDYISLSSACMQHNAKLRRMRSLCGQNCDRCPIETQQICPARSLSFKEVLIGI